MNKVKSKTNKGKTFALIRHLRNGYPEITACNTRIRYFKDADKNEYLIYSNLSNQITGIEQIEN
jgi:hypothetical protein